VERHKLGAHYTPRAYVERLVIPTVVEPLREEWDAARTAAVTLAKQGDTTAAIAELDRFHDRLCEVKVLDPACGTGNFLYVTLEHLKRLEGEVFAVYESIAHRQMTFEESHTVDPHQLLGIEINPRAAAIAELVLWIGYLQWHYRTRGKVAPPEPIIKDFKNIECRDAVLAWDDKEPLRDDAGDVVTHWDGRATKPHPVTGEEVPDDSVRVTSFKYTNPRQAVWPAAEFVVGNPPFIGGWLIRQANGDGYVDALWSVYDLPEKADYVMYWWDKAASLTREGLIRRFGFITTNSIRQVFQRRVLERHLEAKASPLHLHYVIADHPWVDSSSAAAVRIAMTVAASTKPSSPVLGVVTEEAEADATVQLNCVAAINHQLSSGTNLDAAVSMQANDGLSSPGVQLYGAGFIIDASKARELRKGSARRASVIRPYLNGRDFMQTPRDVFVIDFFGLEKDEAKAVNPEAFQVVVDFVKPERDQNRREAIRKLWWRFGWERPVWRKASAGLTRFIVTPETSKHRVFAFMDSETLPDNMLTAIATSDAFVLAVLSSRFHITWSLSAGGTLEDRPRYNKTVCFEPYPFSHRR
jgi:SAM-dependent methyltransferase